MRFSGKGGQPCMQPQVCLSHKIFSSRCSIADVNQALVDDSLVDKEKIGGSNYFW